MVDYERCVMRFPAQDIAHIGVGAAEPIAARAEVVGDPIPVRAVRLDVPSQQAGASQDIGGRVMPQVFGYALGRELLRHHLHQPTRAVGRHGQGIPLGLNPDHARDREGGIPVSSAARISGSQKRTGSSTGGRVGTAVGATY